MAAARHNGVVSGPEDQAAGPGSGRGGDDVLGPVAALRRIAFLLERSRAETYKVKAFRAAADTILPLGDEVDQRVAEGTLRELPGIGASTAEVIEAAAAATTNPTEMKRPTPPSQATSA